MLKCTILKRFGLSKKCGLFSVLLIILISLIKVLSNGHQFLCQIRDCDRDKMSIDPVNSRIGYSEIHVIGVRDHRNYNRERLHKDEDTSQKYKHWPVPLAQSYHYFSGADLDEKDIFKFNIKLNSFSKESSDLLD